MTKLLTDHQKKALDAVRKGKPLVFNARLDLTFDDKKGMRGFRGRDEAGVIFIDSDIQSGAAEDAFLRVERELDYANRRADEFEAAYERLWKALEEIRDLKQDDPDWQAGQLARDAIDGEMDR